MRPPSTWTPFAFNRLLPNQRPALAQGETVSGKQRRTSPDANGAGSAAVGSPNAEARHHTEAVHRLASTGAPSASTGREPGAIGPKRWRQFPLPTFQARRERVGPQP
jgi:hypothetical protein